MAPGDAHDRHPSLATVDLVSGASRLPFVEPPIELLPCDGSAVLAPGFLTPDEADRLLVSVMAEVPWEATSLVMFGSEVAEPRLSAWLADDGIAYGYSGRTRNVHPWTGDLAALREQLVAHTGTRFNGVLVNLYRDGRDHMGWHADDETSLGPAPVIASVSLGAERRFDLRHRNSREVVSCTLPHGSLLVMSGASQRRWTHRLPKTTRVAEPRVNLTFRLVVTPPSEAPRIPDSRV